MTMFSTTGLSQFRVFHTLLAVLFAFSAFNGAANGWSNPQPQITISDTNGMAPFAVHVHAVNSSLGGGTAISARYEWEFGDPNGRHNTLVGFNAAHLYEQAGSYTITLRITNTNGEVAVATRTVQVQPDTRRKLYVAPWGSDTNSGLNEDNPFRTVEKAFNTQQNDTAILIQRGASYALSHNHSVAFNNVRIGTWGSGGRPKLKWVGSLGFHSIMSSTAQARDVVIQDIVFASDWPADSTRDIVDAIRPSGEAITIDHCRFLDVSLAVNTNSRPNKLLVMDCETEEIGAYFVWGDGDDHVYVNNSVAGSHFEHCIRLAHLDRVLITGNTLANDDKRSIWATHGTYIYISNNEIDTGRVTIGPNPYAGHTTSGPKWSVVEGNVIEKLTGGTTPVEVFAGTSQTMVRNNVIRAAYIPAITIAGYDSSTNMRPTDVFIYNNTGINETYIGRFLSTSDGAERISVRNNLFSATNLITGDSRTANVYVDDDSLASFTDIARNVWAEPAQFNWVSDGYHYIWPLWSNAQGYQNPNEWDNFSVVSKEAYARTVLNGSFAPPENSVAAIHSRPAAGVHVDMYGRRRPATGKWSAGAVELNNADDPVPDPDPDPDPDPTGDPLVVFADDFETNAGWTVNNLNVSDGQWERGVPAGDGFRGDPTFDHDGSGTCWLTGNRPGNSDVDGGPTILTSPVIDLSEGSDPYVSFARWIYCDDGSDDRIVTEVSANAGVDWAQLEIASSTGDWRHKTYRINDVVASTSAFQIRFVIGDTANNSVTEAAIDNLLIRYTSTDDPPDVPGDVNGDGVVDSIDVIALLGQWGPCSGCSGDLDANDVVDVFDMLILLMDFLG